MSAPTLVYRHAFGLKGDVKNNIWYLDETTVVYPCGHNIVVYNTETKEQQFIHGESTHFISEGITALAVVLMTSKRYVAVAERSDKGAITMYDLQSLRRKKMLSYQDLGSKEFVSLAFSNDGKLCLSQGGAPEWNLVLWAWEKAKVIATVRASNSQGAAIHNADFCPGDPSMICVTGNGILKFFRIADGQFRSVPMALKRDPQNYLCHAWLSDERVMVATDNGDLMLFESFEFRSVLQSSPTDGKPISSIVAYTKGFVCGGADGTLRVYERSDDSREYYVGSKVFRIEGNLANVTNMGVSPSEDNLICTLDNNQMFVLGLSNIDILKEDAMNLELLSTSFHGPGPSGSSMITGLDVCIRKPLVVTCGLDKSVRVWNYQEMSTDLIKVFEEEPHSVAFHPSGLHILVGFSDKLRLLNLLMGDIRPIKELAIKACREAHFSNGGQFFAAVHNNTIQIYNTWTCELIQTLRGHNGKVRSLFWRQDDKRLVSAGMDGSVFRWDVKGGDKRGEYMQPRCNIFCAVATQDMSSVLVGGSDRTVKEIDIEQSTVKNEAESFSVLSQLALSASGKLLFAGTAEPGRPGVVRAYKLPFNGNGAAVDFADFQCHGGPLTRLRLSHDNQYLFSAGEDGSLAVFEVRERDARGPARARDRENGVGFAEEILVTKSDLEEKTALMQELKAKVDELTLHNEYQLRLKDMNYKEKIKEVQEKFTSEIAQDHARYEDLRDEKRDMELEYEEKLRALDEKHGAEVAELESQYKAKINAEVNRYQALVQERDEQNLRWDDENQLLVESHTQYLAELTEDYEGKLAEEQEKQRILSTEKDELTAEFDQTKGLVEEDADMEIEELKEKYDAKLNSEREATLRLKGENGIMRKKFTALQKDIEDQREEIRSLHEKEKELYENIKGLEKDIQGHKKEIREREETIQDKDKRIYDLKKKNQELEKFKFVLDYKIKELKRQIEPRENEIADMRQQIEEMDQELEQYHKSNAALDLMIGELRLKMDGMQKEINEQRAQLQTGDALIRRFRTDLHECVQSIQEHKALKESIVRLYKKYVQQQLEGETGGEADVQREYNRQREYLEKSVESLKRKLAKDMEGHRNDNMRLMRENVALTREINELRREVKHMKQMQLTTQLGGGGEMGRTTSAGQATGGGGVDDEAWREVEMQQQQIMQLQKHINRLQEAFGGPLDGKPGVMRPGSRERLQPVNEQQSGEVPQS